MTSNYLIYDQSGATTGAGYTPDGTIPPGSIECTEAQAQSWNTFSVIGGQITPLPEATLLGAARANQIAMLSASYQSEIAKPVSYTSKGGVSKTYQADPMSVSNLQNTLLGLQTAQATPAGFYWVASDNTQVPFTYADLQALAAAMLAQGWAAFQTLQTLKASVATAATVAAVQAVAWPA